MSHLNYYGPFAVDDLRGSVLQRFCEWALTETAIEGVLLAGSCAAGTARPDSDVDLIVIADRPSEYVSRAEWLQRCGEVQQQAVEDYGAVQSVRACFVAGGEFEFGFALPSWTSIEPIDSGTRHVVERGAVVLIGKQRRLERLLNAVHA